MNRRPNFGLTENECNIYTTKMEEIGCVLDKDRIIEGNTQSFLFEKQFKEGHIYFSLFNAERYSSEIGIRIFYQSPKTHDFFIEKILYIYSSAEFLIKTLIPNISSFEEIIIDLISDSKNLNISFHIYENDLIQGICRMFFSQKQEKNIMIHIDIEKNTINHHFKPYSYEEINS